MKRVLIDRLKPGMKLAKPVVNDAGMILIGEGTLLTGTHINRLENMSISSVFVEGTSGPAKTKEELIAELDARFRKTEDEPYMSTLKRIMKEVIEGMNG
ncbi:MAG: hypothetical protein HQL08_05130 [Nitrospirae bacterium]|nr:hypothetical protein [Nitrospirota bacterium]